MLQKPELHNEIVPLAWNYEQIKAGLQADLEKYRNLLVTEENLKEMEKVRREIVTYRTQIERFKKKGRDEFRKPMDAFTAQCDELLRIVAQVEQPIARQLYSYEEQRQAELANKINEIFLAKCADAGVRPEFRYLHSKPCWMNRTQKWADTMEDVEMNVSHCLATQKSFDDQRELEAMRKMALSAYAEEKSRKAGLAMPVKIEDTYQPLEKLRLEEGKTEIDRMIEVRIKQEAAVRKAEESKAAPAVDKEPEPAYEEPFEKMKVVAVFRIESEADGRMLNAMLERLPGRMIEEVRTEEWK